MLLRFADWLTYDILVFFGITAAAIIVTGYIFNFLSMTYPVFLRRE